MTDFETELPKLASLAYIELNKDSSEQLANDLSSIIDFVTTLQEIDTSDVKPLLNPLDRHQPLREDVVTEDNQVKALEQLAPAFKADHYLVPKVIDKGE
jgi:aspartyl-tRNA(Asn)/glutamyl-tRNA(Gln) amidotransferase subunit C